MKNFIAVIAANGKNKPFNTEAEAVAHVAKCGGFVASRPAGDNEGLWVVDWDAQTLTYNQVEHDALVADAAANKYKADRRAAYHDIGDQLDMIYWDNVNGTSKWVDHVAGVKEEFPKQ